MASSLLGRNEIAWHTLTPQQLCHRLETDPARGLTHGEVKSRLRDFGQNALPTARMAPLPLRFAREFQNPLSALLALACGLTIYLGDFVDAGVIAAVIILNAAIGFVQEYRAEAALTEVSKLLSHQAIVTREGVTTPLEVTQLVPGDVINLEAGMSVPADIRLLVSESLSADESTLTGESLPVDKDVTTLNVDTALAERTNMVFQGTTITRGRSQGVVVATGSDTELGVIGSLMRQVERLRTPLTKRLDRLAQQITAAVVVLSIAVLAWGYFIADMAVGFLLIAVVGLAVGAIPEGLPAVVTFALASSSRRLAALGALARRLPAVEALGSVDVVYTDKTGTLTKNEMTVVSIHTRKSSHAVTGVGYEPEGDIQHLTSHAAPAIESILSCLTLCNDAQLQADSERQSLGEPTERALLSAAMKAGIQPVQLRSRYPRQASIPFEAEAQFMLTAHPDGPDTVIMVKGSPERVMTLCADQLSADDQEYWRELVETEAGLGHRMLAAATARVEGPVSLDQWTDAPLTLVGMVSLVDPPRPDAIDALRDCREAGVHVVMVTGDHPATAMAIAEQLGMPAGTALTGSDIDELDDAELAEKLEGVSVIARVTPSHKLRLVTLSQDRGHFVAMTGDGVNDAPALRQAHIGVAMGDKGTDVAREAADIVLTDDRFHTISDAIREGRRVYDNIKKSILFLLSTDLDEAALIVLAILFGISLPVSPTQILWVNLVTSVALSFALVVERAEPHIMRRGPNPKSLSLITGQMMIRIVFVATLSVAATFAVFYEQLAEGASLAEAQTAAVTMLVVVETALLINHRRFTQAALSREGLTGNRTVLVVIALLIVLQLGFVYFPPLNRLFDSAPLSVETWLIVGVVAAGVFVAVEAEKWLRRRLGQQSF